MAHSPISPDSPAAQSGRLSPVLPARLYFVRHGHTDWNDRGLFQGRSDIPLNGRGREDAARYAGLVRGYFAARNRPLHFAEIVASPLARAHETARILCHRLAEGPDAAEGLAERIRLDERLQEQFYGLWEGLTIEEIRQRFPGSVERQFACMHTFAADGGESMQALQERVLACVTALPVESLVVGHFGTLFAILLALHPECTSFPRITQDAFFVLEDGHAYRVDREHPEGILML